MLSRSTQDFTKFLPMKNSTDFLPPHIKAYSFRSDLFHEKMIENIAVTTLNKLAHKLHNGEQDDGLTAEVSTNTFDSNSNENKKGAQKDKKKRNDKKLKASDLDLNFKEQLIKKLEKRTNRIL